MGTLLINPELASETEADVYVLLPPEIEDSETDNLLLIPDHKEFLSFGANCIICKDFVEYAHSPFVCEECRKAMLRLRDKINKGEI